MRSGTRRRAASAGLEGLSKHLDLLGAATSAAAVVAEVAVLGSTVAPTACGCSAGRIRCERWSATLNRRSTGRSGSPTLGLGHDIVTALSTNLFDAQSIGYAFGDYRAGVGQLHGKWADAYDKLAGGDTAVRQTLPRLRLTTIDRQSMVRLGDPTVMLAPLTQAP